MAAMKWWGWGREDVTFTHEDKPALGPFIERELDLDITRVAAPPHAFDELDIPDPALSVELRAALEQAVGTDAISTEPLDRVVHARGKSLHDLVRTRRGDLGRLPDVVVNPGDEDEVAGVLRAAIDADAVVIPFGGGTSISGSLEAPAHERRAVISMDLGRLNRVLSIDETSRLARVQTGVLGPDLESQLNARGWTFGHFPDSFTHSSLGGWIATRSSGMQSDRYGDIGDLTRAVRVVTPAGRLVTRAVPSTSTGPSVREMVLGSEGRLGVITEATVHVQRVPECRTILGYLFPTWADGLAAMRDIAASSASPSVTRVSDSYETRFSFATRKDPTLVDTLKSKALTTYLRRRRGFDTDAMCLSFIGHEGTDRHVAEQRALGAASSAVTAESRSAPVPAPCTTRRSSTRRTSATSCSTAARWPTCPRPPRPGERCPPSTTPSCPPPTAPSTSSACRATSCATCRTRITRAHACTSPSASSPRVVATRWTSTTSSSRRSSKRSSTPARRSRTTMRSAPSMPSGSSRKSRPRA